MNNTTTELLGLVTVVAVLIGRFSVTPGRSLFLFVELNSLDFNHFP